VTAFTWNDFLVLARRLARRKTSEADQRTAISRAYYAVFHAASSFIRAKALVPPSERLTHDKVWNLLATDPDLDRADVGRRGDLMKRLRVNADYRTPFPDKNLTARVADALAEAKRMVEAISRLT
jgi:uncharacterized protein (UPF0332 family)